MTLIFKLVNRVAPAYTARVQFSANRDLHDMDAAMREADLIDRRDAYRTMFIDHSCALELEMIFPWFGAAEEFGV